MAKKRRTKKQKENAKHSYSIEWKPSTKSTNPRRTVKRQLDIGTKAKTSGVRNEKNARHTALGSSTLNLKKEVSKSLLLFSLILGVEVVIYLFLR